MTRTLKSLYIKAQTVDKVQQRIVVGLLKWYNKEGEKMLRKHSQTKRSQISMISLDELVPKDHLVRKMD